MDDSQPLDHQGEAPVPISTQVLLHSETLYRGEMLYFDRLLFGIGSTYVTGLVVASAWLASRISHEAGGVPVSAPMTAEILRSMCGGFYFYFFVGITVLSSVLLLIAARSWASIQERVEVLQALLRSAATRIAPGSAAEAEFSVLLFSSGRTVNASSYRQRWEQRLALYWCLFGILISLAILALTLSAANSPSRLACWLYALLGAFWSAHALAVQFTQMTKTRAATGQRKRSQGGPG